MLVSVIMSVYNDSDYLQYALDSILSQTYKNIEIIVVNDGSTDETKSLLDQIKDERLHVIHLPKNKGTAHGLNLAIEFAEGDWIAIHDSDDISFPNRIEEQVKYIKERPELVALGSFIEEMDEFGESPEYTVIAHNRNTIQSFEEIKKAMYHGCPLTHGSMMVSKKVIGKYDTQFKIAHDYDMFIRLVKEGQVENIPKVLYKYRIRRNSLTFTKLDNAVIDFFKVNAKYIQSDYSNKIDLPKMLVIGTEKGCEEYSRCAKGCLEVVNGNFSDEEEVIEVVPQLLIEKIFDGVIVLDYRFADHVDQDTSKIMGGLAQKGVTQNLYLCWGNF